MSLTALSVIQDAAILVGDPGMGRITVDKLTGFLNKRCRRAATRMNLVKWLATFNISTDAEIYAFPDDMIRVARLQYSPTPSDPRTFRDIHEWQDDEYRRGTDYTYPTGEAYRYKPDQGFFRLVPWPTTAVTGGGRIEYWGLPDLITDPATQPFPLRDICADLICEGIVIDVQRTNQKLDEAMTAEAAWEKLIDTTRATLEDPSEDRRERVRTGSGARGFMGQI